MYENVLICKSKFQCEESLVQQSQVESVNLDSPPLRPLRQHRIAYYSYLGLDQMARNKPAMLEIWIAWGDGPELHKIYQDCLGQNRIAKDRPGLP